MKTVLFALAALIGANASATTIYCTQTKTDKNGYYEIFAFQLNKKLEIVAQDEQVHQKGKKDDRKIRLAEEDPALKPKIGKDTLKYHYKYQDEGDGDYPGPKEDHYITLPKSLKGAAHVTVVYDKGDKGQDDFDLECE